MPQDVRTTNNDVFSATDTQHLATLIWRRWGQDTAAAAIAWRRLMQNNCSDAQFAQLLDKGN